VLAIGTAAAACWGLGPVATKAALAGFSPEILGVTRLACAALCFRIVGGSGTRWLPGDGWSELAGVALGSDFLLFNHGVRLTTAAVAAAGGFGQVSNVLLARALLGEELTTSRHRCIADARRRRHREREVATSPTPASRRQRPGHAGGRGLPSTPSRSEGTARRQRLPACRPSSSSRHW
jgi:hypothetical protein